MILIIRKDSLRQAVEVGREICQIWRDTDPDVSPFEENPVGMSSANVLDPPIVAGGAWRFSFRALAARFARWSVLGMASCLSLGCAFAVVLRLTGRDAEPGWAPFFYATPLALVWSAFAIASGLFLAARKPTPAVLAGLAAISCWSWWEATHIAAAEEPAPAGEVTVVFWNTARLKAGWTPIAERISQFSAPIMGFVEAGPDDPESRKRWQNRFPNHQAVFFGNGLVLLAEGRVLETSHGTLAWGCYFGRADVECRGQHITLLVVDIHSNPFFPRKEALARLNALAKEFEGKPVVIMGDFNTPSDSVHFQPLREGFRNAFESGGSGNVATWPRPCPVLAIDHIWTSRQLQVHRAWHESSLQSDHAAVIAELSFPE